jgi:hypothetical protein
MRWRAMQRNRKGWPNRKGWQESSEINNDIQIAMINRDKRGITSEKRGKEKEREKR